MPTSASVKVSRRRRRELDQGLVLVVDDDIDARAAASELLVDLDYWPVTARNGLEALEYLRKGVTPTALIIDLYMPLMDGEALCAACDEDPQLRRIPRIIVSGNDEGPTRVRRCGAIGFLYKPIPAPALQRLIELAKEHGRQSS